jgi:hypothetical protein
MGGNIDGGVGRVHLESIVCHLGGGGGGKL